MGLDITKMAITGFSGDRFYLSDYDGESYITWVDDAIELCSASPVNEDSEKYRNIYLTEINPEDLSDIKLAKIYVKYMGNEYEALNIGEGFDSVILKARKGLEYEDKKNGFVDNINERITWKKIKRDEIEDIRIEQTSVYEEMLKKYGEDI